MWLQRSFMDSKAFLSDSENDVRLELDLPGVSREDLKVELSDRVLTIEGKREGRGEFRRSYILSDDLDGDRLGAELKNGVLRLNLPKKTSTKARQIEVKSA